MLGVLPLAVASGLDPALMAAVALMLSRERAGRLLFVYFVGGAGVSVGAGVIVLFVLGKAGFGGSGNSERGVEVAVGVLLLIIAIAVATGAGSRPVSILKARRLAHSGRRSGEDSVGAKTPSLLERARSGDSPWVAWLAGVAWGVPGASYLAALALIAKSGQTTVEEIGTIVVFNLVMFALVEVPLVAFLVAADPTRAAVQRCSDWMSAHRRPVIAVIAGTLGIYFLVKGLGSQTS